MKCNRKVLLLVLIIWLFLITFFNGFQDRGFITTKKTEYEYRIKMDFPISIDGNDALNNTATYGNGTAVNPYIIENKIIDVSGQGVNGIYIQNTDAYFILRNCTVTNGDSGCGGIRLRDVKNGKIINNTVENNYWGIIVEFSNNTIVANNTARLNEHEGILIGGGDNNITENIVNDNLNGIWITGSNHTITQNKISNNQYGGIYLYHSNNNRIHGNEFHENGILFLGIDISHFIHNITLDNTVNGQPVYYYKHQKYIINPTDAGQVILVNSSYCNISNSILTNGSVGISLFYSNHSILINNTCNFNFRGIFLQLSYNNTLTFNIANHNRRSGICLRGSDKNRLFNNTVNYNDDGIYLSSSSKYNNLTNNTVMYNSFDGGIVLWSAYNNIINANIVNNNHYGVYLEDSNNNTLINNIFTNNWYDAGVYFSYSSNNQIYKNQFLNNGIKFRGATINDFIQEITPDNLIEGRPIYYYKHEKSGTVPTDAAQVILVNSSQMDIIDCQICGGIIGISLFFSNNNCIINNTATLYWWIYSHDAIGIKLFKSDNNILRNNTANYNFYGILLESSNNNTLSNNTANNCVYEAGIYLLNANNTRLINNTANSNDYGIRLTNSNNNTLLHNTVTDNYYGIYLEDSINTTISFNLANENRDGFYLDSSNNNTLIDNRANNNGRYGISLSNSNFNNVSMNILHGNLDCINESPSCIGNIIENNDCQNRAEEDTRIPGFVWPIALFGLVMVYLIILLERRYKSKKIIINPF